MPRQSYLSMVGVCLIFLGAAGAGCGDDDSGHPDGALPDSALPDAALPDGVAPDAAAQDGSAPDAASPDGVAPDAAAQDGSAPDAASPDAALLTTGSPCEDGDECQLGFCTDDYCCEGECAGECRSCGLTGHLGICSFHDEDTDPETECGICRVCDGAGACADVAEGTDIKGDCAAEAATTCGRDGDCDGAGACRLWTSGTQCSEETCVGSTLYHASECDGAGSCVDLGTTTSCDAYVCNSAGTACLANCGADEDCSTGHHCEADNLCHQDYSAGDSCTEESDCADGLHCQNGVCCPIGEVCCTSAGQATHCGVCRFCNADSYCEDQGAGEDARGDCPAYDCINLIAGWDGAACSRFTGSTPGSYNGFCNGSGACYSLTEACTGSATSGSAACASLGCKKSCPLGAAAMNYDTMTEACYTSGRRDCPVNTACNEWSLCTATSTCGSSDWTQAPSGVAPSGFSWYDIYPSAIAFYSDDCHGVGVQCGTVWMVIDCVPSCTYGPDGWYQVPIDASGSHRNDQTCTTGVDTGFNCTATCGCNTVDKSRIAGDSTRCNYVR